MSTQTPKPNWLQSYYFARAAFSIAWVAAAIYSAGQASLATILLVIYPAWDAIANYFDARANCVLDVNRSQMLRQAVS